MWQPVWFPWAWWEPAVGLGLSLRKLGLRLGQPAAPEAELPWASHVLCLPSPTRAALSSETGRWDSVTLRNCREL